MALTASKRIRRDYAPLNVALGVTNSTPNSPLIQVYDPDTGTYNPDRTITWAFDHSGTLWTSILLHATVNALALWAIVG